MPPSRCSGCSRLILRDAVPRGPKRVHRRQRVPNRLGQPGIGAVALAHPSSGCRAPPRCRPHIPAVPLEPAVEQVEPGAVEPGSDQPRVVHRSLGQPADGEGPQPSRDRALELLPGPRRRPRRGPAPTWPNRACWRRASPAGAPGRVEVAQHDLVVPAVGRLLRAGGCPPDPGRMPGPSGSPRTARSSR